MYSIEAFFEIAADEGLEYTLLHYLDPRDIEDIDLRLACIAARNALLEVERIGRVHDQ